MAALHHLDCVNEGKGSHLTNPSISEDGTLNLSTIERIYDVVWVLKYLLDYDEERIKGSLNVMQRERLLEENTIEIFCEV